MKINDKRDLLNEVITHLETVNKNLNDIAKKAQNRDGKYWSSVSLEKALDEVNKLDQVMEDNQRIINRCIDLLNELYGNDIV